jgi:HlyD family secretion protein
VNLTEIDIPQVEVGNKATVTFSAFPDKTFTGEVVSIDTVGSITSGVTTYPAVIKLDSQVEKMLPNMSADANIITQSITDTLLVPVSAIQTKNGVSTVKVLQNGQPNEITVEIGEATSTQVEVKSGLAVGDEVVTSTSVAGGSTAKKSTTTTSPFSTMGFRTGGGPR